MTTTLRIINDNQLPYSPKLAVVQEQEMMANGELRQFPEIVLAPGDTTTVLIFTGRTVLVTEREAPLTPPKES